MPEIVGSHNSHLTLVRDSSCVSDMEELISRPCQLVASSQLYYRPNSVPTEWFNLFNLSFLSTCVMSMF